MACLLLPENRSNVTKMLRLQILKYLIMNVDTLKEVPDEVKMALIETLFEQKSVSQRIIEELNTLLKTDEEALNKKNLSVRVYEQVV